MNHWPPPNLNFFPLIAKECWKSHFLLEVSPKRKWALIYFLTCPYPLWICNSHDSFLNSRPHKTTCSNAHTKFRWFFHAMTLCIYVSSCMPFYRLDLNYYNLPQIMSSWAGFCLTWLNRRSGLINNQHNALLINVVSLINKKDPTNPLPTILLCRFIRKRRWKRCWW